MLVHHTPVTDIHGQTAVERDQQAVPKWSGGRSEMKGRHEMITHIDGWYVREAGRGERHRDERDGETEQRARSRGAKTEGPRKGNVSWQIVNFLRLDLAVVGGHRLSLFRPR